MKRESLTSRKFQRQKYNNIMTMRATSQQSDFLYSFARRAFSRVGIFILYPLCRKKLIQRHFELSCTQRCIVYFWIIK